MPSTNRAVALAILSSLCCIICAPAADSSLPNFDSCGGRLERALDALQRDSPRRNRLDEEEAGGGIVYQQKLASAPLEMIVSRIAVKLPRDSRNDGRVWARVDTCFYEPKSNALQTRVVFNDLSVSGVISLLPRDDRPGTTTTTIPPAESCRMSLRLRRAGIEFYTNPIARGRGQMRIRTESSFLEPRFASIYAYGCRPTRTDKQIKRYDKWPQQAQQYHDGASSTPGIQEPYEAPEPRGGYVADAPTKQEDVAFANDEETRPTRNDRLLPLSSNKVGKTLSANVTLESLSESRVKNSLKRETRVWQVSQLAEFSDQRNVDWLSREPIATEMERVFLRGASQALTRYIERQFHPAIKETLMTSMGYTISYG